MEKLFMSGPRAIFGRKSAGARPVEEVLATLSDAAQPRPKRKRAARKPRVKTASAAAAE